MLPIVARDDDLAAVDRKGRGVPAQAIRVGEAHTNMVSQLFFGHGCHVQHSRHGLALPWPQRELSRYRDLDRQARGPQLREALESLLARIRLNKREPSQGFHPGGILIRELVAHVLAPVVSDGEVVVSTEVLGVVESDLLKGDVRGIVDDLEGVDQTVADLCDRSCEAVVGGCSVRPREGRSARDDALVQRTGEVLAYDFIVSHAKNSFLSDNISQMDIPCTDRPPWTLMYRAATPAT